MPLVDCPNCDGFGGWTDIDGLWVECNKCDGHGYVDDEDDSDDDED